MSSNLAEYIKNKRTESNLTQQQLSKRSGLSKSLISSIENGLRPKPDIKTLENLARALSIDSFELKRLAGYLEDRPIEYKIEVNMKPHEWDNPTEPYFWCIKGLHNGRCNKGCGWSATPEQAWKDAVAYYERFKKESN